MLNITSGLMLVLICSKFVSGQQEEEESGLVILSEEGNKTVVTVSCTNDNKLENINRPQDSQTLVGKKVVIDQCLPPKTSYVDALIALKIDVKAIEELVLENIPNSEPVLHADHFVGISLQLLQIAYPKELEQRPCPDLDILAPLKSLTKLKLSCTDMLPLPMSTSLEELTLESGSSLGPIGGCENLREILTEIWDFKEIPMGWLSNCTKLTSLTVKWTSSTSINVLMKKILVGAKFLRKLTIQYVIQGTFEMDILSNAVNLEYLEVTQSFVAAIKLTKEMPSLQHVDFSNNNLRFSAYISNLLTKTPSLRSLNLDENKFLDLCDNTTDMTEFKGRSIIVWKADPLHEGNFNLSALETISAQNTATSELCCNIKLDSFVKLNLAQCKITTVEFQGLLNSKAQNLEVKLQLNPVQNIKFVEADYYRALQQNLTVSGFNYSLDCDCQNEWLARAAREWRVMFYWDNDALWGVHAYCDNGKILVKMPQQQLACDKYSCAEVCTCRTSWRDNATDARCAGELRAVPRVPGLRALHAANNLIGNITTADLPDTLLMLDISRNHVKRMDDATTEKLFSVPARSVRLAGNPLICDCENQLFLEALRKHKTQVTDFDEITCANDGRALNIVPIDDLCALDPQVQMVSALASVGVLVAIAAAVTALYYRYQKEIKVFLFARGWCLMWLHEEEIDADREYDAFLSFSHVDYAFVVDTLLPELEREPHPYKICIHTRDWHLGEFIPAQITRSVEQSRRTIIVLSKSFLESVWGMLEFRAAHVSTLQEGRVRIIAILLDDIDIDDEKIDAELRGYLKSNTYLKCGDAWFWEKLRYAMPHRRGLRNPHSRSNIVTEDHSGSVVGYNNPIPVQQLALENGQVIVEHEPDTL